MIGAASTAVARSPETVPSPEVADLVRRIADGREHVRAGIQGPGGSGKTTLLGELATVLRARGFEVARGLDEASGREVRADRLVVLVDDAHQLDDAGVAVLDDLSRGDDRHVVVAFRPWPRSAAMARLVERFGAQEPVLALHPLSTADVRESGVAILGEPVPAELAARLLELTRGNPRLVDLALGAMRDDGWDAGAGDLPAPVLEGLRDELDALHPEVHEFLLAMAVGYSLSGPAFATAPRFAEADTRTLLAGARASGLASPDGSLVPIVRAAILQSALGHELWSLRRELVVAIESAGLPLDEVALDLAQQGYRDPRVEAALRARADELLPSDPAAASVIYAAMIDAGADESTIAGRLAQAAWGAGDARTAERLVDRALGRAEQDDLRRVIDVAAATWARKGMLERSADAYLNLATSDGSVAPLAVVCLAGIGDLEAARRILAEAPDVDYPTSSQVALHLMADGILASLEGTSDHALSSLLQASSVLNESGEIVPLPEAPAVLAAEVALNAGELGIANEVLEAAVAAGQGGPAFRSRLLLMQALVALRADRPLRAREHLAAAEPTEHPLGHRDEVLAHAVRIGLARRTDDIASLTRNWASARQGIARIPVDLFMLPALAELSVAAARLHETQLVESHVTTAWQVLERSGSPACWSASLHWAAIEAAILLNDTVRVERHAAALTEAAPGSRAATRLARAGRTWAAALAGDVVVEAVERAVADLAAAGYPWDASRLAGHAAARAPEHKDTLQLLALARSLHHDEGRRDAPGEPAEERVASQRDEGILSAREREVARLVLEGRTYVEIGNAIFISPRTAEHHIARIRRRLGVSTRSELLARLRIALEDGESGQ